MAKDQLPEVESSTMTPGGSNDPAASTPPLRLAGVVASVMAAVTSWAREVIGQRTRDALHERRDRVARLAPTDVKARIVTLAAEGMNGAAIARLLDAEGVPTPSGVRWYPSTVRRMIASARLQGVPTA